jgi:MFS family permease
VKGTPPPQGRTSAIPTLMLGRAVYAFNWYNVGAVLPVIGSHLRATTPELGIVVSAFFVGAAAFQLVAGFAVLRWGSRNVSIFALFLMGAFATASAFSPDWIVLAILRFGVGAGAAFFFAPALGLIASYYGSGTQGPMIGLYNGMFSIGSGIGLFPGAFIGAVWGWQYALLIGGIGLLVCAAGAVFLVPPLRALPPSRPWRELWASATPTLRSRSLWFLSLSTAGLWGAFVIAANYFINYAASVHPAWPLAIAAGIPVLMIVLEIPGGPIGGWIGERTSDRRQLLLICGIASGVVLALVPYLAFPALFGLFAVLGFADGVVFAVLYLVPVSFPEARGENLSLGFALLNGIQIFIGSGVALAFALLASAEGYTIAWWFAGAVAIAPLPLLLGVPGHRTTRSTAEAPSADRNRRPVPPD